ncbi:MAG: hypothetical protein ACK5D0_10525, partial [Burkholderiaceae bacterium]
MRIAQQCSAGLSTTVLDAGRGGVQQRHGHFVLDLRLLEGDVMSLTLESIRDTLSGVIDPNTG